MRAGRLKPILELYTLTETGDGFGSRRQQWTATRILYAERTRHTGSERIEHGELFTDYRAEYKVRIQTPVKENQRVKDLTTGTMYGVQAVFPERDKDMKRLMCERVND